MQVALCRSVFKKKNNSYARATARRGLESAKFVSMERPRLRNPAQLVDVYPAKEIGLGLVHLDENLSIPLESEADREPGGEMLLGWKWITSLLVLLAYSAMVMLWLPRPEFRVSKTSSLLQDEELLRHLNLSSSLLTFTKSCERFLLEGGRHNEDMIATGSETTPMRWSGGEWHYSWAAETDEEYHLRHQKFLEADGRLVRDREATFSVKDQTAHHEWSSEPLKPPIHAVEGLLVLKKFGKSVDLGMGFESVYPESAPDVKLVDDNQMPAMQNLKVFLKGADIVGRRLCMTGCAYRNDHSFRIDCGFILKMTYPTRRSMTSTWQIEAELSSARTGMNDPLCFPAIRLIGSNLIVR